MRPWLLALLVIAAAFSGCASEPGSDAPEVPDDTDPDDSHDHDDHDHGDDGDDGDQGQANNTVPAASLTADVLNGTAPLLVNLTLDGSDADGDALSWVLEVNGTQAANGTALPATHSLNLTAGNHSVLLTVSDGEASATADLTIVVEVGVPAGPCGGEPEPCIVMEDTWVTVWSDGRCDATNAVLPVDDNPAGYIHDRRGPDGEPLVHFGGVVASGGGGIWLFEESNGIPGLQLTQELSALDEADAVAVGHGCLNGDTMIF